MASENATQIQATSAALNQPQLGCVDEISAFQDQPIFTRLDKLLWNRQRLSALRRTGSLDPAQSTYGLLASVAKATHQGKKPDEARGVHVRAAVACGITSEQWGQVANDKQKVNTAKRSPPQNQVSLFFRTITPIAVLRSYAKPSGPDIEYSINLLSFIIDLTLLCSVLPKQPHQAVTPASSSSFCRKYAKLGDELLVTSM